MFLCALEMGDHIYIIDNRYPLSVTRRNCNKGIKWFTPLFIPLPPFSNDFVSKLFFFFWEKLMYQTRYIAKLPHHSYLQLQHDTEIDWFGTTVNGKHKWSRIQYSDTMNWMWKEQRRRRRKNSDYFNNHKKETKRNSFGSITLSSYCTRLYNTC